MIDLQELAASVDHLPTLGTTFARLSALEEDRNAEMDDFAEVIQTDPALAAVVLRAANSAEFGLATRVFSISQAVAVLGTRKVMTLALAQAFREILPDTIPGYGIDSRDFWKHCVAVGVLSQSLAKELGLPGEDESFVAGLLHDIGKLVLGVYLARVEGEIRRNMREEKLLLVESERAVLGVDHCAVGMEVARKWNLPPGLAAVARFHHAPSSLKADPGEKEMPPFVEDIVDLVHMADCLAHQFGYGTDIGELSREIKPGVMERIGVSPFLLEGAVSSAFQKIEERFQSLEIDR